MTLKEKSIPILKIILGNLLMGFAYAKWMKPDAILNGGVTSISMIASKGLHLPLLLFTNGITLFLLVICWLYLGKQNFFQSILSSLCYTSFFSFFYKLHFQVQLNLMTDFLLASLFIAIGYYCCITANASTVGMDVFALIAHKKNPEISIAKTIRLINFIVLGLGFFIYGIKSIIIGIAFSYVNSWILNFLLQHTKKALQGI